MAERGPERLPAWMLLLAGLLAVVAYMLFDLQRWAGTPTWEAALLSVAMGGAAYVATATLVRGVRGLDRWAAVAMLAITGVFLLVGAADPLAQSFDLTAMKLPLRVALAATPPMLMIGAVMLLHALPKRRPSR